MLDLNTLHMKNILLISMKNILLIPIILISLIGCSSCSESESNSTQTETTEDPVETIPENLYPTDDIIISTHTEFTRGHYPLRIAEFKANPLKANDIVFIGNSITEQGGNWGVRLNNSKAKNRGISGDTTEGVLTRLGEIIYVKPTKIFILIGINDLFQNVTVEALHQNILSIVNEIHTGSPITQIYVQTILPTTTVSLVSKIQQINSLLVASQQTGNFTLIDLHSLFSTESDLMNMVYSTDGTHLKEVGYAHWVKKISSLVTN
jgi:lysophospholipase L1-like esterase